MRRSSSSRSGSKIFSDEALDKSYHFKWRSIRNLLYLTFTYSSHPPFFYMFNFLVDKPVTIFYFTALALVFGMTYMCAELFIKQYTQRLDWDQNLCPVLKGITVSLILQYTLFCLLSLRYAGDGARYLSSSFASTPIWSVCTHFVNSSHCMGSRRILQYCEEQHPIELLKLNVTSVHIYYMEYMKSNIRGAWTWRFFVVAVMWILNFCLTTVSDSVILKFYKYLVQLKHVCSILTYAYLAISTGRAKEAFFQLMNINTKSSIDEAVILVALVYGIGMIGVHDFGSTSPFTMTDNAVIIFTVLFILLSAIRSMTVNILLLELRDCLDIYSGEVESWHYIFFVLLPLATEFLYCQKLINISLYLHVLLSLLPCLLLFSLTVTRLLHSEFPSIKFIYIQGLICLFGFILSVPILLVDQYVDEIRTGLIIGLRLAILYLGGLRMAIIMWIYGVKKFSTDINFWLGFSPTKFWTVCWSVLPAILWIAFCCALFNATQWEGEVETRCALVWCLVSAVITFGFQIRIIARYAMKNNLMGAFRNNKKYGPFDKRDRKRRRRYDVSIDERQCFHDCLSFDEDIDCNHLPLMNTGEGPSSRDSQSTLTQMYESVPSRTESVISIMEMKPDTKEKQA